MLYAKDYVLNDTNLLHDLLILPRQQQLLPVHFSDISITSSLVQATNISPKIATASTPICVQFVFSMAEIF